MKYNKEIYWKNCKCTMMKLVIKATTIYVWTNYMNIFFISQLWKLIYQMGLMTPFLLPSTKFDGTFFHWYVFNMHLFDV